MLYRIFLCFVFILFFSNCTTSDFKNNRINTYSDNNFSNRGFTLVYSDNLYNEKIVNKKLDERDLIIFQKNLKKNSLVKITNILNNKSLIVKVGDNSYYPSFNNSVISKRISNELNLNPEEPYVEIVEILDNSSFVAKKAKIFDEEKVVANKVPVNDINISDLNNKKIVKKKVITKNFLYFIKVADFYYNETALMMLERIKAETKIKKPKIKKISSEKYRVYLGPFDNINSLQNSYNDINILGFENIEIIKND